MDRDQLELAVYAAIAVFNGAAVLWWLGFLAAGDRPRYSTVALFGSFAVFIASLAVTISQGFYTLDREHVITAGRWLRPILMTSLFLAGLAQFIWSHTRQE